MVAYFATTHIIFQLPFLTCQCILGIFNPSLQKFNFYTASFSARYLALTILFFFQILPDYTCLRSSYEFQKNSVQFQVTFSNAFSFFWVQGEDICFFGCLVNFFGFSFFPDNGRSILWIWVPHNCCTSLASSKQQIQYYFPKPTNWLKVKTKYMEKSNWNYLKRVILVVLLCIWWKPCRGRGAEIRAIKWKISVGWNYIFISLKLKVKLPSNSKIVI